MFHFWFEFEFEFFTQVDITTSSRAIYSIYAHTHARPRILFSRGEPERKRGFLGRIWDVQNRSGLAGDGMLSVVIVRYRPIRTSIKFLGGNGFSARTVGGLGIHINGVGSPRFAL